MQDAIVIHGAKEHNLKNISLTIPREKLVVITGLSGSGKSSLAFDTIYAEGQRRYLESLSAYVRQFLEQMKKPAVDSIEGLSPSISIEQKNISRNPRSTVGTVTEVYDFLRLLYARVGEAFCPVCKKPIQSQSVQQIVETIQEAERGLRFAVLAPIARGKKGEYQKELLELRSQGYVRARIDGKEVSLAVVPKLQKTFKHDISVYIDRLILRPGIEFRLSDAVEIAVKLSGGLVEVEYFDEPKGTRLFSTKFACHECGTNFPEIEPRSFSFNSHWGACASCDGMGSVPSIDPERVVPNPQLSIREGAILPWESRSKPSREKIYTLLKEQLAIDPDKPFIGLSKVQRDTVLYGSKKMVEVELTSGAIRVAFDGVIPTLEEELGKADGYPEELEQWISQSACKTCKGTRLKSEMLCVRIGGLNIAEVCELNLAETLSFVKQLKLPNSRTTIAEPILAEIKSRLTFLLNVGLSYLTLSRSAASLSGGEAQRMRLTTQIGSALVGVLYVLDEPSIGLHPRDNERLLNTLSYLRDSGNSVLVVEHDEETIKRADFVIDLGPGAGEHGGELVFSGTPAALLKETKSLTGQFISGSVSIEIPVQRRRRDPSKELRLIGAKLHNLKNLDVSFPLGTLICVTGVSGSGKSSLVIDTLLPILHDAIYKNRRVFSSIDRVEGLEHLDKVVDINQAPIGRTPRSNPATYTGLFSDIRTLFAGLPEAKSHGYLPGRFSFNVEGGRCEVCQGDGSIRISMNFLPDVYVPCEVCGEARYNLDTLRILYKGKSISDVLKMTVEQAFEFFERVPQIRHRLQVLLDVGLSYVQLGQSALTFSGGEAQRIKLAKELSRRATGRTLYILDEPTTGLHFADIKKLLEILQSLVNHGNTVVVIEHNLDVIKQADHVIDLGPEGGTAEGGNIVFEGTPEEICRHENSHTGKFLRKVILKT